MKVEIELKSAALAGDIHALKKHLEENMDGLRLEIQSQPAAEDQILFEATVIGILHGILEVGGKETTKTILEQGKKILSLIKHWNKYPAGKAESPLQTLGPGVSVETGDEKYFITENDQGELQAFDNFNFAINPERTYALLVGVSEFESDLPPIPPVRNNLVDFYNLLSDKHHVGLPRKNIQVVFNKTDHEIQETMLGMSRTAGMETLLIYYSGHGHKSDIRSLTLTARNTRKVANVIIGGIDLGFITEKVLRPSTASQKILILDACHSGIAAQGEGDITSLVDVKGTYTLTSSGNEASYFDKLAQNTYFTGCMLDLLRKGINDATKEMLSLDDIYRLSSERLGAAKFPKPDSKNELNIAAADFFLARNPSFSADKLKQKATHLMKQGKLQEAMHEYIILLQRYRDDARLKKEADECRNHLAFTQLVDEGDHLYITEKDYRKAFEKYKKALNIKDDLTIAARMSKCRERLRLSSNEVLGYSPAKLNTEIIEKDIKAKERELKREPAPLPGQRSQHLSPENKGETPATNASIQPAPAHSINKKSTWIAIALVWLIFSGMLVAVKGSSYESASTLDFAGNFRYGPDVFTNLFWKICFPFLVVAALLIGIRNKNISTTEILIYIVGFLPSSLVLISMLTGHTKQMGTAFLLLLTLTLAYIFYFRAFLRKFSLAELVIGCLPLLYFMTLDSVLLFFILFQPALKDDAIVTASLAFAGIAALLSVLFFARKWREMKTAIPVTRGS